MIKLPVVENFVSINGEGMKAGQLAHFIRFAGCNLRCNYCDTMWANDLSVAHDLLDSDQIIKLIRDANVNNITLTGGEPLMQENLLPLLKILNLVYIQGEAIQIEIETNGSMSIKTIVDAGLDNVSLTMDYKLPDSQMESHMNIDNFVYLRKQDTVKFVSSSIRDLEKAYDLIDEYDLCSKSNVFLSPVFGKIEPKDIVEFMKDKNNSEVRLQIQLHKVIWDPQEKGV